MGKFSNGVTIPDGTITKLFGANSADEGVLQSVDGVLAEPLEPLKSVQVYASDPQYAGGVKADGVTDDTNAIRAAIAAANAFYSNLVGYYKEVILPPGIIRTTGPILVQSSTDALKFRLRGAGRNSTVIRADFFTTTAAPQFTVSGGGGSGAVLYPMIEFGFLKAVMVISGGSGYSSAPTATLTAPFGSGAVVTCTISGGIVTAVTVTNKGSGYASNYEGDVLVLRGACTEVSDLSISATDDRKAAGNGGVSAYPYFTTNNGIRIEPFTANSPDVLNAFTPCIELGEVSNVTIYGQPGHNFNGARMEQWLLNKVFVSAAGADGFFLHTQGGVPGAFGIANRLSQCRSSHNGYRGINAVGWVQTTFDDCVVFLNLEKTTLPSGVNEEIYLDRNYAARLRVDVERNEGDAAGKDLIKLAGCFTPKVEGYFRGGRYGVYCAACRSPAFDNIEHYGNPGAVSNAVLFFDGGTGNIAGFSPLVGTLDRLGNVNLLINKDSASRYLRGYEGGVTHLIAMRASQYPITQSASYTPSYFNGTNHVVTMSGNVNFVNPTDTASGVWLTLILVQDTTGGRTPSFGTAYAGVGDIGSGSANQIGILELQCVIAASRTIWVRKSWSGWA